MMTLFACSRDSSNQTVAEASAVSSFPLCCKEGKRRRGVPRHQAKVSISVQRDQDQQDGKAEITVEPKAASPPEPLQAKTAFVRISCTRCTLSNWPLLAPFPLNIWGVSRAYISRTSHHMGERVLIHKSIEHKNTSTSGGCSSPCIFHHQPKRQSTTTTLE